MKSLLVLFLLFFALPSVAADRVVHIFVALCDNASQGIAPVPAKIGNGDDPANNLYWGCNDGVRTVFSRSKAWKRLAAADPDGDGPVMERLVFYHAAASAWLVADAYRGKEIKRCLQDYLAALAGTLAVEAVAGEKKIAAGGAAGLIIFAGHNALMEFDLPTPAPTPELKPKTAIALCCVSRLYFEKHWTALQSRPLLGTTQLMYPAGQVLRDATGGWLDGKTGPQCLQLAAAAYAANQKISRKAAAGVFWTAIP